MMSRQNNHYALISDRAFVVVTGEDRFDFLQGLITNDVMKAQKGDLVYSCLLTPQGKYLCDFFIFAHGDALIIDITATDAPKLASKLKMYKLRSKINLTLENDLFFVYQSWPKEQEEQHEEAEDVKSDYGFKDPRREGMGYRYYNNDALHVSGEPGDYDIHRVCMNVPEGAGDIERDKSTMLEVRMDEMGAVDFKKGCYMGQELTARTHYRGLLKRKLYGFKTSLGVSIAPQDTVLDKDDKNIGQVRSVYRGDDGIYGFALLKVESDFESGIKTEDGTNLQIV